MGDRPGIVNVGIILTDGKSNNEAETLTEALLTRKVGCGQTYSVP